MPNTHHTSTQYDLELESMRSRVLVMGGLVERQARMAMDALFEDDITLSDRVISDDRRVNALEVEIDESCTQIIVRRQPTAIDLRVIMMIIKTITDLERIGDEAKKIALAGKRLAEKGAVSLPRFEKIRYLGNLTLDMLRKSLTAFANMNVSDVSQVVHQDQQVDDEFEMIMRYIATFMIEDPRTISSALEFLFIAKSLERIGDHAKNISEYVVYMVKGHDVRHVTAHEIEQELQK